MSKLVKKVNEIPTLDFESVPSNTAIDLVVYSVDLLDSIAGGYCDGKCGYRCQTNEPCSNYCEVVCTAGFCESGRTRFNNRIAPLINLMRLFPL